MAPPHGALDPKRRMREQFEDPLLFSARGRRVRTNEASPSSCEPGTGAEPGRCAGARMKWMWDRAEVFVPSRAYEVLLKSPLCARGWRLASTRPPRRPPSRQRSRPRKGGADAAAGGPEVTGRDGGL